MLDDPTPLGRPFPYAIPGLKDRPSRPQEILWGPVPGPNGWAKFRSPWA